MYESENKKFECLIEKLLYNSRHRSITPQQKKTTHEINSHGTRTSPIYEHRRRSRSRTRRSRSRSRARRSRSRSRRSRSKPRKRRSSSRSRRHRPRSPPRGRRSSSRIRRHRSRSASRKRRSSSRSRPNQTKREKENPSRLIEIKIESGRERITPCSSRGYNKREYQRDYFSPPRRTLKSNVRRIIAGRYTMNAATSYSTMALSISEKIAQLYLEFQKIEKYKKALAVLRIVEANLVKKSRFTIVECKVLIYFLVYCRLIDVMFSTDLANMLNEVGLLKKRNTSSIQSFLKRTLPTKMNKYLVGLDLTGEDRHIVIAKLKSSEAYKNSIQIF